MSVVSENTMGRPDGSDDRPERSKAALLAAAVLLVVVIGLVLVFGIARPPALPSLAEQPDPAPPAAVAWTSYDTEDGPCLQIATSDGGTEKLDCNLEGEVWAWDDAGIVVYTYGPRDHLEVIDPATGELVERREARGEGAAGPPDGGVRSRTTDGILTVTRDDTRDVLWEVDAPEGYRVSSGAVSPDGAWVAMFDSAERLLLVPADGSSDPRVWAEGTTEWGTPVWEGTPLPPPTS
jgi:outer membrane protein assembly factor BamB